MGKRASGEAVVKGVEVGKKDEVKVVFEVEYRGYRWRSGEERGV